MPLRKIDKTCLSVWSDNPDLSLRYVSEQFLLSGPVSSQDKEKDKDGHRDDGQWKVDGEDERTRGKTFGTEVGLAKDSAQVGRSIASTEKQNEFNYKD